MHGPEVIRSYTIYLYVEYNVRCSPDDRPTLRLELAAAAGRVPSSDNCIKFFFWEYSWISPNIVFSLPMA